MQIMSDEIQCHLPDVASDVVYWRLLFEISSLRTKENYNESLEYYWTYFKCFLYRTIQQRWTVLCREPPYS